MLRSIASGQQLVALLHLVHQVGQHRARLVRLDDDRRLEVRQVAVGGQLDALEVDQDQAHLVRVARISRLVMSALTQTLLPEPVAPAMSRCGMRARSTA